MPSGHSTTTTRSKRTAQHYSCDSCRLRKLRCDRPTPCANCTTRGVECLFSHVPSTKRRRRGIMTPASDHVVDQQTPSTSACAQVPLPTALLPTSLSRNQENIMAEIEVLKKAVHGLEARVSMPYVEAQLHDGGIGADAGNAGPTPHNWSEGATPRSPCSTETAGSLSGPTLDGVGDAVAHLELVSMSQNLRGPNLSRLEETIVFKIQRIQSIPEQPSHTMHSGRLMRCIHLPQHREAKILAERFLSKLSYVYHVLHEPSLSGIIDETYRQISDGRNRAQPGHIILLLSIIASSTHVWAEEDCCREAHDSASLSLFSSASEANAQTTLWTKAAGDVLHAQQGCAPPELEAVLGIVVLTYLTYNLEGASLRYRSLLMMGFVMGQELGLHRVDGSNYNHDGADAVRVEVGRRAWWYLVATDWISAVRYGSLAEGIYHAAPHQMMVRKPLNINDVDLTIHGPNTDRPLFEPTDMSYYLYRLRVAEVARAMIDDMSVAKTVATETTSAHDQYKIMSLDSQLAGVIQDIPPFLDLDTYGAVPGPDQTERFIQAYLLNSLIQSQRCKLHLNYLRSPASGNRPRSASIHLSREMCLYAAHRLIRAERQLEGTGHIFTQTRLRLSVILHGIFTATIVLLMDACVYGGGCVTSQQEQASGNSDAAVRDALRIVEEAKPHSLAATRLHESLMQMLARYREENSLRLSISSDAETASALGVAEKQLLLGGEASLADDAVISNTVPISDASSSEHWAGQSPARPDARPMEERLPFLHTRDTDDDTRLPNSLDEFMNVDGFEWELFSILGPSSFF